MHTRHTVTDSPLGPLTLVGSHENLIGVYFRNHWHPPVADTLGPASMSTRTIFSVAPPARSTSISQASGPSSTSPQHLSAKYVDSAFGTC